MPVDYILGDHKLKARYSLVALIYFYMYVCCMLYNF